MTFRHPIEWGVRSALHEIRCRPCRGTWTSWVLRVLGDRSGFEARAPKR